MKWCNIGRIVPKNGTCEMPRSNRMTLEQLQNSDKTALSRSQALTECMFDGLEADEVINWMVDVSREVCAEVVYELSFLQGGWKFR